VHAATPAALAWLGGTDGSLLDAVHPQDAPRLLTLLTGEPPEHAHFRFASRPPDAGWRVLEVTATTPTARGAVIVGRDTTRERQAVATLVVHREMLTLLAGGEPLAAVLDALARSIEAASGGARVAVLVARDADLELAAAPSLRADVAGAFARVRGGAHRDAFPEAGPLSGRLAEVADDHGLGFGWAAPVRDGDEPLAALLLFPGAKRFPSADEQTALLAAVPLAQVAIGMHRMRAAAHNATRDDPLTGVLGRQAFLVELASLARRSRDALGVLLVSVDGVADVNVEAGFAVGDGLLREVGARLATTVRGRDIVGRYSSTCFAIACAGLGPASSLSEFADRVRRVLEAPVVVGDVTVPVQARVGEATRRGRVSDLGLVLRDAEAALDAGSRPAAEPENVSEIAHVTPPERRHDRRSGAGQNDR
jgi:diguanylate cyclase (GGDEF)-like protein